MAVESHAPQISVTVPESSLEPMRLSESAKRKIENDRLADAIYTVFTPQTRTYLTYLLGLIITTSTITATIYFPLIPMLGRHFSVSIQAINLTVTVYAICQAVSPILFASLADASGRRPVILALLSLYALASLGLSLNKSSYAGLVVLRAVQSIGASATPAIAYGVVADVATMSERGNMLGPMLSTCNGIAAVGPVIGGAVASKTGAVTWVFLALMTIGFVCLLLAGFTLPETSRRVVGNGSKPAHGIWKTWRSHLLERPPGSSHGSQATSTADNVEKPKWRVLSTFTALRIIFYPDAAGVLLMIATSYCVYYTFQVAIPVIYEEIYGFNNFFIGLAFLPGLAGMTIGGIVAGKLLDLNYANMARKQNIDVSSTSTTKPQDFPLEAARYRDILPILLVEVALIAGYGWAVRAQVHVAVPLVIQFFACGTSTLLSHTASALLVDIFPNQSSTAYASGQVARCGLSAASAAILQPLVEAVGRGWYFTIFALFVGLTGVVSVSVSLAMGREWRQKRQYRALDARAQTDTALQSETNGEHNNV
ncbi:major facilitator superfamily domain-containing protein [Cadophora sp. MPI-SDFR-AT-0126]|nr:major facilitator superfamily domain-containing protein [Leotiomycetes sp. MPI-SDFR-AT-0126]